jgi:hypothetical protein
VIEPKGHVSDEEFETTRSTGLDLGFRELESSWLPAGRSMLLEAARAG